MERKLGVSQEMGMAERSREWGGACFSVRCGALGVEKDLGSPTLDPNKAFEPEISL